MVAANYPFLDVMWTMIVFFCWILWLWLLFAIWADIFRRHDIGGLGKTGWLLFTIILPFLGVFVYLIAESKGMNERALARMQSDRQQFDQYVRETATTGGSAAEIERAKGLLDSGVITQPEFEAIKAKAIS